MRFTRKRGNGLVSDEVVFAVISAIEAKNTFGDFDIAAWLAAALAGLFTYLAVNTFAFGFADAPNREPADDSQKRAKRTNEPAVKSRYDKIQQDRCCKHGKYQPAKLIVTRVD